MSIECRLSVLMGEKRYNMQNVMDKSGLDRTTVSNLYHDRLKRIDYGTLDKICKLFECTPSDVLRFTNDEEKNDKA